VTEAYLFRIRGIVQGVGFRPFVHRIAARFGLAGSVTNDPGGVVIRAEGDPGGLASFRKALTEEAPPASRIVRITARRIAPQGISGFSIGASGRGGTTLSTIPPDIATCPLCLAELRNPSDRRYGYPFINCTNCGPRFTIVSGLPYDRVNTSMAAFPLCPDCRREYEDPADRRFHAEPNACPACGPTLTVVDTDGNALKTPDPAGYAAAALSLGDIVALRGLGGFHLAADATSDEAVRNLRERKFREEKPFAVMVADLTAAARIARVSRADAAILASPGSPVLLLESRTRSPLSPCVAPGLSSVGIFLPYTPLHRLLLAGAGVPLVMTSGNRTDEPIATGNAEGLERLKGIADLFLLHDREIVHRSDDSVVRRIGRRVYPIRRARGFVPSPIVLRRRGRFCVAGLGGELKNTFCILKEGFAYLSQHIGDLDRPAVRDFYSQTFSFFRTFLDADLDAVCHDLHPGYFTTSFAEEVPARRILALQHHKAHLYSLLAESGFRGKAVGVSFDGTGYGEDGAVWGGEFFVIDGMKMDRAAALADFPLPGGDAAVREPWRTALALLHETFGQEEARETALRLLPGMEPERVGLLLEGIAKGINVVPTSSCGRLFDGVAALAGVCRKATFEGQAPMLLEGRIGKGKATGGYDFRVASAGGRLEVDWKELIAGVVADVSGGVPPETVSRRFHDTMARIAADVASRLAEETGARHVLLSGGVFQNVHLLEALRSDFRRRKLTSVIHREVPANDGGISLGQAYYAAHAVAGG
jgi:hydrogenase maturation protein HypF